MLHQNAVKRLILDVLQCVLIWLPHLKIGIQKRESGSILESKVLFLLFALKNKYQENKRSTKKQK